MDVKDRSLAKPNSPAFPRSQRELVELSLRIKPPSKQPRLVERDRRYFRSR